MRADEGVVGAAEEHQLVVLRHLLREAHAAVAEDAAFAVDRHQGRELERLLEVALRLDEARAAGAPAERDVLERALAALVADGAVERVIHEQELDNRVLRMLHPVRGGHHHHAVAHGRRARGLELRDSLDLDEAHAARAHRLPELRLVTEVRDLDVALLRGVHEHRALRRAHLLAVDLEGDPVLLGAGHVLRRLPLRARRPPLARRGAAAPRGRAACAHPPCAARTRRGSASASRPPAWPSSRPARRGSCR